MPQHLSKGEFDALINLSQNKHIIIQKPDRQSFKSFLPLTLCPKKRVDI